MSTMASECMPVHFGGMHVHGYTHKGGAKKQEEEGTVIHPGMNASSCGELRYTQPFLFGAGSH